MPCSITLHYTHCPTYCIKLLCATLFRLALHLTAILYTALCPQVKLGEWLHTQRRQRASGVLMPVRAAKLDKLAAEGMFSWSLQYVSGNANVNANLNTAATASAVQRAGLESRVQVPDSEVGGEGDVTPSLPVLHT